MDTAQSTDPTTHTPTSRLTDATTIPCPPGRRPCMIFQCPDAAAAGSLWCTRHRSARSALTRPRVPSFAEAGVSE